MIKTFARIKLTIVIITEGEPSLSKATITKIIGEIIAANICSEMICLTISDFSFLKIIISKGGRKLATGNQAKGSDERLIILIKVESKI